MISALIYTWLALTVEASNGVWECPCITNTSADFAALQAALLNRGLPQLYGTEGCKAYDNRTPYIGCSTNALATCQNPWCYVDTELCRVDEDLCRAAGGQVGSDASPYCRKRTSHPSSMVTSNMTIFKYSYEACDSLDKYGKISASAPAGQVVRVAVDAWAPWVVTKPNISGKTKYGGAMYEFFVESLDLFDPGATMKLMQGWATPESRAKFSSSYTACVHDVAVGNFDICVADLWITTERTQMARFTPPVRYDYFYLTAPTRVEEDTFSKRLRRPFAPLTDAAWGQVALFLISMCAVLVLIRMWDYYDGHFAKGFKVACKFTFRESCLTCFDIHHNFLAGGTHDGGPETMANMVFKSALAVFALIIIASYTASLASILVVQKQAVGIVANIEEAIDREMTICVPGALSQAVSSTYPHGSFVTVSYMEDSPRWMYARKCDAAILSEGVLDAMHAGNVKERDCNQLAQGELTLAEAFCQQGFSGNLRNDCDFISVGGTLFGVPVGYPVNVELQHGFAWAFSELATAGIWEQKLKLNVDTFPKSKCKVEKKSVQDGLDVDDLSGTLMISYAILFVGCLLFVCQIGFVKSNVHRHGDIFTWLQEEIEEFEGVDKNSNEVTPESTQPSEKASQDKGLDDPNLASRQYAHGEVISKLDDLRVLVQDIEGQTRAKSKDPDAMEGWRTASL